MTGWPHLVAEAERRSSAALVGLKDGKPIAEWYGPMGDVPLETMSVTKSVVGLLVARAVADGVLRLNDPVSRWFPQWRDGPKESITVGHIASHTSGLARDLTTEKIYAAGDFVAFALDVEVADPPGMRFDYNNAAVNLLPAIIQRAATVDFDAYVTRMFNHAGVTDFEWQRDRAGNPQGMAGLAVRAGDLARLGHLMLTEPWARTTWAQKHPSANVGLLSYPMPWGFQNNGDWGQWLLGFERSQAIVVRTRAEDDHYDDQERLWGAAIFDDTEFLR